MKHAALHCGKTWLSFLCREKVNYWHHAKCKSLWNIFYAIPPAIMLPKCLCCPLTACHCRSPTAMSRDKGLMYIMISALFLKAFRVHLQSTFIELMSITGKLDYLLVLVCSAFLTLCLLSKKKRKRKKKNASCMLHNHSHSSPKEAHHCQETGNFKNISFNMRQEPKWL